MKSVSFVGPEGKVRYQWISPLGPTTVIWNDDSRLVAVSDSMDRTGDRLWILRNTGEGIVPLRKPDGVLLKREIEVRHGSFFSSLDQVMLRPFMWRDGRLWCEASGTFIPRSNQQVRVPFRYLWVFRVTELEASLEEEWTKSFPGAGAFRVDQEKKNE